MLKAIERAEAEAEKENSAETSPQRSGFEYGRADALADMAESYLAKGPSHSSSADRYQVVLHVSAETLTNTEGDLSHLEDGPHVSAETSRRLCCDAGVSVLSEDENGNTLNIGRKTRIIPPGMRRALKARDEGCRFPGCTHKHYIDGHHIEHWSRGGETSLANLVQLCRQHHRLVHEGEFSCRKNEQGTAQFYNPLGKLISTTGVIPPLSQSLDITERMRNRYEDLFIDANTCVTHYDGSPMDWNLAVGALFQ